MEIQPQKRSKNTELYNEFTPAVDSSGIIAIYDHHAEAEAAVKKMQRSGYDMRKLSIVARDYEKEENIVGFYNIGDRSKRWGKVGAMWGGLWGMLFGSALIVVPGIGPLVVAGAFVSTLISAAEGAFVFGSLSALGAALFSLGIPKDSVVEYETDIRAGKYVMIAHGSTQDLEKAREIISSVGGKSVKGFDSKNVLGLDTILTH